MNPFEVIAVKRAHLARLSNKKGAIGELAACDAMEHWIPRPKGAELRLLLAELVSAGVSIKPSSFDAIALPEPVDLRNPREIRRHLSQMVFIEIKTANQDRVKPGFDGFFFALTESEISAAEQLGARHRVALFNTKSGEIYLTSVADIVARAKSMTWQLSVQL